MTGVLVASVVVAVVAVDTVPAVIVVCDSEVNVVGAVVLTTTHTGIPRSRITVTDYVILV